MCTRADLGSGEGRHAAAFWRCISSALLSLTGKLIWFMKHIIFCRNDEFDIKWKTNLSDFLKYCRTWSFVQKFYEANSGKPDLLQLEYWYDIKAFVSFPFFKWILEYPKSERWVWVNALNSMPCKIAYS